MNPIAILTFLLACSMSTISTLNVTDRNPYTKATDELLLDLRQQMLSRSIKFDEHFRNLLTRSKLDLHKMFADTYGMMYEQNTEIFTGMFEGLEQYYANGQIKLTKSMENFFERLYQKIFQVFNQNRAFSPSYLECATEQLAHLKPFKDVPDKLINGIRHAFVAARTFEQALIGGIDFIKGMISLGQPARCTNLINDKLIKNSLMFNQQSTTPRAPCLSFCEQVITRCIGRGNLESLETKWRGYVSALAELAMKLSINYNIETIIGPLDVQISEAIMNFQENAQNISQHVFQSCGHARQVGAELHLGSLKPASNRLGKRAATVTFGRTGSIIGANYPVQPHQISGSRHLNNQQVLKAFHQPFTGLASGGFLRAAARDGLTHGTSLLPEDLIPINQKSPLLIDEIKNYMLSTKSFWSSLPNAVCTSNTTMGYNASTSSKKQTNSNCFVEPLGVMDTNSDLRYRMDIHQLVADLDSIRSKIEQALAGDEIDWGSNEHKYTQISGPILGKLPIPVTTTTTTTTNSPYPTDEIIDDDVNYDDDNSDDIEPSEGSGSTDNPFTSDTDDYSEMTTEFSEDDSTEPSENSMTSSSPTDTAQPGSNSAENPNSINNIDSSPPVIDDPTSNLITPPDAQRSGEISNKLVISNESNLLLASLLFVALKIVTNLFQTNYNLINSRRKHIIR